MTSPIIWDALAGIGTVLAVLWAVITSVVESRKRRPIEKELRDEKNASERAKRREQADRVAVWLERRVLFEGLGPDPANTDGHVVVGNYSGAPIFNVELSGDAVLSEQPFVFEGLNVLPPTMGRPWSTRLRDADPYFGELLIHVEFRDVAGVRWRRSADGSLEEAPRPSVTN